MGPKSFLVMRRDRMVDELHAADVCSASEVIFDPSKYLKRSVVVLGTVREVLPHVSRFDVSDGRGGKLIVDGAVLKGLPAVGDDVRVGGTNLRVAKRRTEMASLRCQH